MITLDSEPKFLVGDTVEKVSGYVEDDLGFVHVFNGNQLRQRNPYVET